MSSNEYAISLKTNRLISKSTANYRKLKKLGLVREIGPVDESKEIEKPKEPTPKTVKFEEPTPVLAVATAKQSTPEPGPGPGPEFDERDLQVKMAELTTSMVATNVKQIMRAQKLSADEYDLLLKKMLYQKLCMDEKPTKPAKQEKPKKKAKKKFKVVSSESESEIESC